MYINEVYDRDNNGKACFFNLKSPGVMKCSRTDFPYNSASVQGLHHVSKLFSSFGYVIASQNINTLSGTIGRPNDVTEGVKIHGHVPDAVID